ncbi:MAG: metallophosphoesterase, partial [Bacteroidota bacterium]
MSKLWLLFLCIPLWGSSQRIFLIGDAGEPKSPDKNLELLSKRVEGATSKDVLIFLGDNLYPKGLPDKEDHLREEMEAKLIPQLDIMKRFPGKSFMIPGNHDWAQGKRHGWQNNQNMEAFVNEYLQNSEAYVPIGGCPGPLEIPISEYATLIFLNTQYLLHPWDKPDEDDSCDKKSTLEALQELSFAIRRNKDKHIIIAAHHPIYTYGPHHGNFPLKQHLIPLPVLGSIHPFYRRFIGNIQDNTHPKYRAIAKEIVKAMNLSEHVIYASGHEHSLQLIEKEEHHFIVSGSGSKATYVTQKEGSTFAKSEQGFAEVLLADEGKASVQFWGADNGLLFEKELYRKEVRKDEADSKRMNFSDSSVVVEASKRYVANASKEKWLGKNYRKVWSAPMEFDVIDLSSERGGLKVLKRGGGMQTKSLRLEAEDGRQYVLRSIEKYPENAIPEALKKTFAQDIVQDQISASHPYGAYIVPTLAEAAQIYHTNPKPVWIPDEPLLGQHRADFKGTLALYEERPNKEAAGDPYFGGADGVKGTGDILLRLQKDNDNQVDQDFVVRNRLFDLWIGDWDRHDDQWRWAVFKEKGKGEMYRPIPRDRDQAFFISEGIIASFSSRKWALPKVEGFDEEVRWAPGLGQNARFFDRTFMSEPDWADWMEQVTFLKKQLTDEVIEDAIAQWPKEVQELTGERIRSGLRARRADMERYGRELYLFLSKEVEVVGSDKHEYFTIDRQSEDEVKVTVRKRKKDGEIKGEVYSRVFKADETKEVRLYGLDGEDVFEMKGLPKGKVKVRIIGGTDKDRIINATDQKLANVRVYDRQKSTKTEGNAKGILRLSKDPAVNNYNRKEFKYDVLLPLVTGALNPDDGLFLGGGFTYTKNAWRKYPYASKHTLTANTALATDSYNFSYKGSFTDVIGKWDIEPSLTVQEPFFVNNFFGLGNETVFDMNRSVLPDDDDPIDFYRIQTRRLEGDLDFSKNLGSNGKFTIGPGFRRVQLNRVQNRILESLNESGELPDEDFQSNKYFKLKGEFSLDTRDQKVMPKRGMTAFARYERFEALESFSESFDRLSAEWAFY